MKSILDPTFKYKSAVETDLRETFKRIRAEQKKQQQSKPQQVIQIRKGKQ